MEVQKSKNILLGVCGSISCYKAYDLTRELTKKGHQVRVILTAGAQKFLKSELFSYLGAEQVFLADDDFKHTHHILHIELAKWADHFSIIGMSANTLSKLVAGSGEDLLCTTFLAYPYQEKCLSLFPAMNSKMLAHPFVRQNLQQFEKLQSRHFLLHPTSTGRLACGDVGEGKLASVEEMILLIESLGPSIKKPKKYLITTGATITPLDPVRYLTNSSSGKTGLMLALEILRAGHDVEMIAGKEASKELDLLVHHPHFKLTRVISNQDMYHAVQKSFNDCDVYISSAAISDFKFELSGEKIKKSELKKNEMTLKIAADTDILAEMIKIKTKQKIVGFAAETQLTENQLQEKLKRKPVDLLIGTQVHNGLCHQQATQGFESDDAQYLIYDNKKPSQFLSQKLSKNQLAHFILEHTLH